MAHYDWFAGHLECPPSGIYRQSSTAPDSNRGNLDNKELVVGSVLYLPVQVAGGLISIGDGHGLQGDGEVSLTALETSLRGSVQIFVRKGKPIHWPRAETPTHFITMGLNTDLDEAARMATREMIEFLVSEKHFSRETPSWRWNSALVLSIAFAAGSDIRPRLGFEIERSREAWN